MASSEIIEAEVLIVGGGMVGLTLGCALAGAGMEVAVVDRADPACHLDSGFDGRASAIAHGTKLTLDGIGVWSGMARDAEPIREIRVSDGDSPLFLHYDHRDLGNDPLGYMVENRHFRQALYAAADGVERLQLVAPTGLRHLTRTEAGGEAELDDGRYVRARLVIAADGRQSAVRREAGIPVTTWTYDQTGIVCTVTHERSHRGIAHERFLSAGPFAILPLSGNRSSLVWTERSDLAPAIMALDHSGFHAEMAGRFGGFLGLLQVTGPRWSYPLALSYAARYNDTRLALVGDAAHAIHPIAGQGLNLGLRDVAALSEVLVDARRLGLDIGGADVLARYGRWRRVDTTLLLAVTDSLNRLFSNDIAPLRLARDLGLAAVNQLPPLKRLFMRHAMGTVGDLPRLARGEPL
ncbi:MAG: UbiH/UbiF/VisC/COQ6 family ubiquinone biosynthesis hydroxylase [Alphaproteobacteria bacterium]